MNENIYKFSEGKTAYFFGDDKRHHFLVKPGQHVEFNAEFYLGERVDGVNVRYLKCTYKQWAARIRRI